MFLENVLLKERGRCLLVFASSYGEMLPDHGEQAVRRMSNIICTLYHLIKEFLFNT